MIVSASLFKFEVLIALIRPETSPLAILNVAAFNKHTAESVIAPTTRTRILRLILFMTSSSGWFWHPLTSGHAEPSGDVQSGISREVTRKVCEAPPRLSVRSVISLARGTRRFFRSADRRAPDPKGD